MTKLFGYTLSLIIVLTSGLSSADGRNQLPARSEKSNVASQQTASVVAADAKTAAPSKRRTIAVLDFGDASLTDLKKNLGRQLAILLSNEFTKQGQFVVVERIQLDRVTSQVDKEEDVDRYKDNPLVRIGKLLKADALILGDITEFTATKKGSNFGIVKKSSYTAKLGLAIRLVDISSGEVLDAVNLSETADEKGGSNPFWDKGAQIDEDLKVTLFTKAANQAVGKAANQLNKLIQERIQISTGTDKPSEKVAAAPAPAAPPAAKPATAAPASQAKIVKLEGSVVTINMGKLHGVTLGKTFAVVREDVTVDPDTNEVLDRKVTEIGRIKITEVRDGVSVGSLAPGSRGVKVRDLVKEAERANP